ncbi:MAG: valine--tRNA ligase [Thermoplasmata archaeon]|nr:valine--tRNA ligase [Thermoplasmata archaeon]
MTRDALPTRFEPGAIEARWQETWRTRGYFRAPVRANGRTYTVPLPPPNVTGVLTIGHMLSDTVQDVLVRWHRMKGDATLWVPGIDHAGLATQVEVRKRLAKEGIRFETLPRAEALHRIEEWKLEHERRILEQLRVGGFSLDFDRYRYTMDAGYSRATRRAFVTLYKQGRIYRGERIVNWDPKLQTAVSDLEVVFREETTTLIHLRYPGADGSAGIVVATVRPETIFGDVAVAVHPDDERHRHLVGTRVRVPLTDRDVPVITDAAIDREFGTGALKVTPRHDAIDYGIAQRHPELPLPPETFDNQAKLHGPWVPEQFRGLDREKARGAVVEMLRGGHYVVKEESLVHQVGRSERSDAIIEPRLSFQWFVRMAPLAVPAVEAVRKGDIRIHPPRWELTFYRWMESLEDWCISRQVLWGHPIPVYTCPACKEVIVEDVDPVSCPTCGNLHLVHDPDVLDTWFSSWMWPFAVLGWPEETSDLREYYPTSVLVTGRDIMFFWVARMMMAGYLFTGRAPFSDVYFHGMMRDASGHRMSKHLGNSPDPIDVVQKWGADALRFALVYPSPTDQDGTFGEPTLEGARNFLTKIWNMTRFLLSHLPEGTDAVTGPPELGPEAPLEDRWLLSRYARTAEDVERALGEFEFTRAAGSLYSFLWHDVADRYIEIAKDSLSGERGEVAARRSRHLLLFVLDRSLTLLHPFVPHVTEELWHALPHRGESLMVAPWPMTNEATVDPSAELTMEPVLETIRALRQLRSDQKFPPAEALPTWARPSRPEVGEILRSERRTIERLVRSSGLTILDASGAPPADALPMVTPFAELFLGVPAGGVSVDSDALLREKEKLAQLLAKTRARLADAGFRERAPPELVREAEGKAQELEERIRRIETNLARVPTSPGGPS